MNGERRIYVRSCLEALLERWTVAHECGHVLLGHSAHRREPWHEEEANAAAAALLAPVRALLAAADLLEITEFAQFVGLTQSSLIWRHFRRIGRG